MENSKSLLIKYDGKELPIKDDQSIEVVFEGFERDFPLFVSSKTFMERLYESYTSNNVPLYGQPSD